MVRSHRNSITIELLETLDGQRSLWINLPNRTDSPGFGKLKILFNDCTQMAKFRKSRERRILCAVCLSGCYSYFHSHRDFRFFLQKNYKYLFYRQMDLSPFINRLFSRERVPSTTAPPVYSVQSIQLHFTLFCWCVQLFSVCLVKLIFSGCMRIYDQINNHLNLRF